MAPASSQTQPVFLARGTCGDLIICTADQWQRPRKVGHTAVQDHGVWTLPARASGANPGAEPNAVAGGSRNRLRFGGFTPSGPHSQDRHLIPRQFCASDHETKALVALEDASTASGHSDDDGSERCALPGTVRSDDSLLSDKSLRGNNKSKGGGKGTRSTDDGEQQKQQLEELGLQRPLLLGPFKEFTDSLVGQIVDLFGGAVLRAQVMKGARSQSGRCSLMLWPSSRVRVSVSESAQGGTVTIEDPMGGRTVVENLREVFPTGAGQVGKPICVQQAKNYFVPGPGA